MIYLPTVYAFSMTRVHKEVFQDFSPRSAAVAARDDRTIITSAETGQTFVLGETAESRTIFAVVSLFCAVVLSLLLGKCLCHDVLWTWVVN